MTYPIEEPQTKSNHTDAITQEQVENDPIKAAEVLTEAINSDIGLEDALTAMVDLLALPCNNLINENSLTAAGAIGSFLEAALTVAESDEPDYIALISTYAMMKYCIQNEGI